jgi:asparagine synthase (glutamine-hydrolysing)
MCGITGIVGGNANRKEVISRMTDALVHRGPDESGYFHDTSISLGQRRLSIIDLVSGRQPISNETGEIVLICNGEIYNSPQLRKQLIARGHSFRTETDVETILHLYEDFGANCVNHLRGMFAFAIWDQRRRTLLIARDHLGQKPVYYAAANGSFCFASEVKALLATDWIQPEVDLEAIWHYMSTRFVPGDHSFFKSIHKLPAGHLLEWRDGHAQVRRYWDLHFLEKHSGSDADIIDGMGQVLDESVRLSLLSDVPVGAFLSGGIDSSTIASMMAQHSITPVPSFSIGVREQEYDELRYARVVGERYGMDQHERIVSPDIIHLLPEMIKHMDEPSDPYALGVYLASQLASESVKVVLSGDGGDENFAGYDRYAGQRYAEWYAILPRWLRATVMRKLLRLIPDTFGYQSIAQKARWLNEGSLYKRGQRYAYSLSFLRFASEMKYTLFTQKVIDNLEVENSDRKVLEYFDAENADELIDRMLYTDLMTRMPDHQMVIADRMSMAHSLESRAPLLDHKLSEYAARMPPHLKLHGPTLKYALKQVAGPYLPAELLQRRKQGFGFPIAQWMRADFAGCLQKLFQESRFVDLGWFRQEAMDKLLAEHLSGAADHNFRLWILLNLELWYRLYFDGMSTDELTEFISSLMRNGA